MKEALDQLSLYSIKIYAFDLGCDIDGGSYGPVAADLKLSPGPDFTLQHGFESNQYHLPPLIYNGITPGYVSPISLEDT